MNVVNIVPMALPSTPQRLHREPHVTVLRRETTLAIAPRNGGLYIDATIGAGGHAEAILETPGTRVIGIDRDERALEIARARLTRFEGEGRLTLAHGPFSAIEQHLDALGVREADGLIADVGVSSMQLEDAARGMSFRMEGPLDMRMDTSIGQTAVELIDTLSDDELADVIYRFGDERRSRRIARCVKQARAAGELDTTLDLRRAVVRAVGPARVGGVDPATRTFQALRIAVNGELDELTALLDAAGRVLGAGGVIAIISFHSLEDRIVKRALRDRSIWETLSKKPVIPSDEETAENPRARSAKLRAARRVSAVGVDSTRIFEGPESSDSPDDDADADESEEVVS